MQYSTDLLSANRFDVPDHNQVGIICYDAEGMVLAGNDAFLRIYGAEPAMLKKGRSVFEFTKDLFDKNILKPSKRLKAKPGEEEIFNAISSSIAKRLPFVTRYESTDGKDFVSLTHPSPDGGWISAHVESTNLEIHVDLLGSSIHPDPVTGLPNKNIFLTYLEQSIRDLVAGQSVAVYVVAIDQLQSTLGQYGADATDEIMAELSHRLSPIRHEGALLSRINGNQIAIMQKGLANPLQAAQTARRVQRLMRYPFSQQSNEIELTASIGIAIAPQDTTDSYLLNRFAGLALSDTAGACGGRYSYFTREMDVEAARRRELQQDLRDALASESLEIHYQPIVDLCSGQIVSCEALLRWKHPKYGYIAPDDFIHLAERSDLISRIGAWVLREACSEALNWPEEVSVAVNVSPVQFNKGGAAEAAEEALRVSGIAPHRLVLEVTESVLLHPESALLTFQKLGKLGVKIALDDFGMGHSSLSYFRKFSFDQIKIDRSYVAGLNIDRGTTAIIRSITTLADGLGIPVVAEGVETERQQKIVKSLGCTRMQGFVFSPALCASEFAKFFCKPKPDSYNPEASSPDACR